ncbi:hypothetical protein [Epilithonimonas sp.]|uniref:hypothetical protein n=1 Tax=Epilithonimonas sp. TaxID=2894511 RepID=UPI00289AFF77|nr:hypothetical protein [Epilithonimonas sp.]
MIKKILVILSALCFTFYLGQVNFKNNIKRDLETMLTAIKSKNMDKATAQIYPKYFKLISKDQMKQILNMTYNNPAIHTNIQEFKILNITKPKNIQNEFFSFVDYGFKMNLKIDFSSFPNGQKLKKQISEGIYTKFGKDNVTYNAKSDYYIINAKMKAYAISANGNDWKFIIVDKKNNPQLVNILPKEVLD